MAAIANDYYSKVRTELLALGSPPFGRCLDLGCGEGTTGEYLLSHGYASEVVGVECSKEATQEAKTKLSGVLNLDLNRPDHIDLLNLGRFDTVVMGDILEHLVEPHALLSLVASRILVGSGKAFISLPNVQSTEVLLPLVQGEWEYKDSGILDATHLRFFTRRSAEQMIAAAGLEVVGHGVTRPPVSSAIMRTILRALGPFGVRQHMFACRKP